jgi:hypothetical protein
LLPFFRTPFREQADSIPLGAQHADLENCVHLITVSKTNFAKASELLFSAMEDAVGVPAEGANEDKENVQPQPPLCLKCKFIDSDYPPLSIFTNASDFPSPHRRQSLARQVPASMSISQTSASPSLPLSAPVQPRPSHNHKAATSHDPEEAIESVKATASKPRHPIDEELALLRTKPQSTEIEYGEPFPHYRPRLACPARVMTRGIVFGSVGNGENEKEASGRAEGNKREV